MEQREWGESFRGWAVACLLLAALLLSAAIPVAANAAECTTTWTGAAEGNWTSVSSWSGGKIPSSGDVACIGTGKTVKVNSGPQAVGVVQGEGSLKVAASLEVANASEASTIGGLTMETGGVLTGAGTVRVSKTFSWAKSSTMSGAGSTVLLPGATGSQTSVSEMTYLKQREFVNEGTFTHQNGQLSLSEGARIRNTGTYNQNTGYDEAMLAGAGGSSVVNTGTFQKTGNIRNIVGPAFENKGSVISKSEPLAFSGGTSTTAAGLWEGEKGKKIEFVAGANPMPAGSLSGAIAIAGTGTLTLEGASASGAEIQVEKGTLSVSSSTTISTLTLNSNATLTGAGSLKISKTFSWAKSSTMSGSGSTVLLSGGTGSQTSANEVTRLKQREFINEGTFSHLNGQIELAEGAALKNTGTYSSNTGYSEAILDGAGAASVVNTGTFKKTANISNTIEPPFENKGAVLGEAETLSFSGGGVSKATATWETKKTGRIQFAAGEFTLGGVFTGAIEIVGSKTTIILEGANLGSTKLNIGEATLNIGSGTSTVAGLTMNAGMQLVGPGTLRISEEFAWKGESTMSGSGSTVILPTAVGSMTAVNKVVRVKQREFINEGTFSHLNGQIELAEGAALKNTGTYSSNTGYSEAILDGAGSASVVNTGTFKKTANISNTIEPPFENKGAVIGAANTLAFGGGGSSKAGASWEAKEGGGLEFSGGTFFFSAGSFSGPVNFGGSKTTISLEGANLESTKLDIGEATLDVATGVSTLGKLSMGDGMKLTGPGTLEIAEELSWEGVSTMSGSGSTVILPGATGEMVGVNEVIYIKQRELVNKGTFTHQNGQIELSEGALLKNTGTFNSNSGYLVSIIAGSGGSSVVNTGTFQKTEDVANTIAPPFENYGDVIAKTEGLGFAGGGVSGPSGLWQANKGALLGLSGGAFSMEAGALAGDILVLGSSTSVSLEGADVEAAQFDVDEGFLGLPSGSAVAAALTVEGGGTFGTAGTMRVADLTMKENALLTGSGTMRVGNSFSWEKEGTMSGAGETVLLPGSVSSQTSVNELTRIKQRELINEGTFTHQNGQMELSEGAILKNRGTFNSNSGYEDSMLEGSGGGMVVNTGIFQKTEDIDNAIEPPFKNLGQIFEKTSNRLIIKNPVTIAKTEEFGQRSSCGDPVDCATGNFFESQTDVEIPGRGVILEMTRTYSAQAAADAVSAGAFGYGWIGSFSERLAIGEGAAEVTLIQADGSTIPFVKTEGSNYAGPSWSPNTLTGSPETGYVLVCADQTELSFSSTGRLQSVEDRSGNKTSLAYDESGHLEEITDPSGRQLILSYNVGGQVESVEDPLGQIYEYAYESGELVSVTYPGQEQPRWEFDYDEEHRMTDMTDGREGTTTNAYDADDRIESQTDPGGDTLTFEYEPFHTVVTNGSTGAVTDQWFTSNNQPAVITHGYGTLSATTETFSYDDAGQLIAFEDGNGNTTTYGYDAAGNRTSEKAAEENETKWAFNGSNDLVSITTPGGEATTITRDGDGNPEAISKPGPGETTQTYVFEYDEHGQIESLTDPLERTWSYDHDSHGNLIENVDPLGGTLSYDYDDNSQLVATVSRRGNVEGAEPPKFETTIEWDDLGQPAEVEDPLGRVTKFAYDGNGNLTSETDPRGKTTKFAYSPDNELIEVEKPNGAVLETEYDGAGDVVSQTDAEENTTTYVRNVLGQAVEVVDPLSRKTKQEFDAAGNLRAVIDAAERKTSFTYDDANRLIAVSYSDEGTPDTGFEYDADGNLTTMTDGTGESTFAYDQLGRLIEVENGNGDVVDYDYDLAEQLTEIVYPNGKAIARDFDEAGRLERITDWLGGTTSFGYDADSNLTEITFPNASGNVDEYVYDSTGRMTDATFKKGAELLAEIAYTRNKVGQVESEALEGLPGPEEISFGYDDNHRLISAGEAIFEYDLADNLTQGLGSTNSYDDASQLETGTEVDYAYDALGQRTEADPAAGPAISYGYDQAGNLISIDQPEEGEIPAIDQSFTYDGSGLIASRTIGATTLQLTWDVGAATPLLIADEENSYIYGPGGLPVAQISSEEVPTYLHHDQLGSTRLLTGAGGAATATFSYEPYGALTGSTGSATTPFKFAGEIVDPETGLQYLRARFYDPATGQFLSRDPQEAVTRQPYAYAFNDPTNLVDRSGENPAAAAACAGTIVVPGVNAGVCGTAVVVTGAAVVGGVVLPHVIGGKEEKMGDLTISPKLQERIARSRANEKSGCKPSDMPNFGDPSQAPGEDWEWRGGEKGAWHNPKTKESLRPDLNHPEPIGPHYDYRAPDGSKHRVYPDGRVVPK